MSELAKPIPPEGMRWGDRYDWRWEVYQNDLKAWEAQQPPDEDDEDDKYCYDCDYHTRHISPSLFEAITCPECGRDFDLSHGCDRHSSLHAQFANYEFYGINIKCPHCGYEEEL